MRFWVAMALLAAAASLGAEDPPAAVEAAPLRWTGQPLRLPFECTPEDLSMFEAPCTVEAPCPVFLQLVSARGAGEKIFLAGNLHNRAVTMYSVLLRSDDGGQSWLEAHPRIRGAGLDLIYFHDAKTGWVAGHVLTVPPRDPFFLLTTDGGLHWRRRNVFDEPRTGVIEEFWFEDARSGGLLIDRIRTSETGARYERYETMTGGADWSIREVSATPIRVRNVTPAAPDPDWRVSEDGGTGAWRLERRRGGDWAQVASFEVQVGACAPKPPEAAPEPPTEAEAEPHAPQAPQELPVAPGGVFQLPGPGAKPPEERRPPPAKKQ